MENDKILLDLLNVGTTIQLGGKEYSVKKATLRQSMLYRARIAQAKGKSVSDQELAAYAIFLVLKDQIPDLTEDWVLDNARGDVGFTGDDVLALLTQLGFVSPEKMEMTKRLQRIAISRLTGEESLPLSPTAPDGRQTK